VGILWSANTADLHSHRLSTIMNANLIIVIKDGEIVEKGSHEELISAGGKYFQLWSKQLKNEQPKPSLGKPTELNYVNDLSPRSREQELKKVSGESGTVSCPKSNLDDHPKPKTEGVLVANAFHIPIRVLENGEILSNLRSGLDTDRGSKSLSSRRNFVTFANEAPRPASQGEDRVPSAQGVLKDLRSAGNSEMQHMQLRHQALPRAPSSLKPDAQEFVPNEFTSKGYAPQSTSDDGTIVANHTGGPLIPRESKNGVVLGALTDVMPFSDQSGNVETEKEGDMHGQNGVGVDRIQALQEKIGRVLKSSEAKVQEMEEGRGSQILPVERQGPGTSKASKIYITVPNVNDGGNQCAIDTENCPASPTESHGELQPEPRKKRRRNRRRSNKSKSIEESDNMVNGGSCEKTQGAPLSESPSLPSMKNISPRSCGGEFPPALDGSSSIDKKQKRRSSSGLKASNPKAEVERAVTSLSTLSQTISSEELSRKFKGKNGIGSVSEGNFRVALKEDLRPKSGDGEHMVSPPKPVEHPTPISSVANRNTLREQNRRRSWGKSTVLKGSWRRSERDDRHEGADAAQGTGLTDGA